MPDFRINWVILGTGSCWSVVYVHLRSIRFSARGRHLCTSLRRIICPLLSVPSDPLVARVLPMVFAAILSGTPILVPDIPPLQLCLALRFDSRRSARSESMTTAGLRPLSRPSPLAIHQTTALWGSPSQPYHKATSSGFGMQKLPPSHIAIRVIDETMGHYLRPTPSCA